MNIEEERKEFEEYANANGMSLGLNWCNEYSHITLVAWHSWLAAKEHTEQWVKENGYRVVDKTQ